MTRRVAFDLAAEAAAARASATLATADHLDVVFSSGGLAFTAKRQPDALGHVHARLNPLRQQVRSRATHHGHGRSISATAKS